LLAPVFPSDVTHTSLRYRHAIAPVVLLLAAMGVRGLWQWFACKSGKKAAPQASIA
jgi:hypothetical protein